MAWHLYDETGKPIVSQGSFDFTLTADSGTDQTVNNGDTVDITGGAGIATIVGATNTITVQNTWDYEQVLSTSGAFDVDLTTDVSNWDNTVKTIIIQLIVRSTASATAGAVSIYFNNDTNNTNYYRQTLGGYNGIIGVSEEASARIAPFVPANMSPANSYFHCEITISEPNNTNYLKPVRVHGFGLIAPGEGRADAGGIVWQSTSAITRIQIRTDNHPTNLLATHSALRIRLIK